MLIRRWTWTAQQSANALRKLYMCAQPLLQRTHCCTRTTRMEHQGFYLPAEVVCCITHLQTIEREKRGPAAKAVRLLASRNGCASAMPAIRVAAGASTSACS